MGALATFVTTVRRYTNVEAETLKALIFSATISVTGSCAIADEWSYQAPDQSSDHLVFFYAYTNDVGHPDSGHGNDLTLIRDPNKGSLRPAGHCSFDDCTFKVSLNSRYPSIGDAIVVKFPNGERMEWTHQEGVAFLDNYASYSMGATNIFYNNIRLSEWVDISFGGNSHRFDLTGSNTAMDAIIPHLN